MTIDTKLISEIIAAAQSNAINKANNNNNNNTDTGDTIAPRIRDMAKEFRIAWDEHMQRLKLYCYETQTTIFLDSQGNIYAKSVLKPYADWYYIEDIPTMQSDCGREYINILQKTRDKLMAHIDIDNKERVRQRERDKEYDKLTDMVR